MTRYQIAKKIIRKARPMQTKRQLAQKVLTDALLDGVVWLPARINHAVVIRVRLDVVIIEVNSRILLQEFMFKEEELLKAFRTAGLNVRRIRIVMLNSHGKLKKYVRKTFL